MFLSPGSRSKPRSLNPIAGIGVAISKLVTGYKVSANLTQLTASTSANIALNNTATYFDGPTITQGTSGVWMVIASATVNSGSASPDQIILKLWDGSTVFGSAKFFLPNSGSAETGTVAGIITNPVGNIKLSVNDGTSSQGVLLSNNTGLGKDSSIVAVRIG